MSTALKEGKGGELDAGEGVEGGAKLLLQRRVRTCHIHKMAHRGL